MRVAKKNSWMWPRLRVVIPLAKWMCLPFPTGMDGPVNPPIPCRWISVKSVLTSGVYCMQIPKRGKIMKGTK
jgi:hypothetical protein